MPLSFVVVYEQLASYQFSGFLLKWYHSTQVCPAPQHMPGSLYGIALEALMGRLCAVRDLRNACGI